MDSQPETAEANKPQVVVRPQTIKLTREQEQRFVTEALGILQNTRIAMGWADQGCYSRDSWLWQRAVAMKRYHENDFSDRLTDPTSKLWAVSNKSLNLIQVTVDQHLAKLSKDFSSGGFLGLQPDGPEDVSYILKPAEQFLTKRANATRLGWKIKNELILGALVRGEVIGKALPNTRMRTIKKKLRILLHPSLDGTTMEPARDSAGGVIHEEELWVPHSEVPDLEVLARDPLTHRRKGTEPTYSDTPREIPVTVSEPAGADISFPFWADFVADLDKPDLDQCTIKAHLFEAKPDDLWDMLPKHLLTPAAEDYYRQATAGAQGSDGQRLRSEQSYPNFRSGENENTPDAANAVATNAISDTRLYAEIWIRYDLDGDRHREDLCLLVDMTNQWPITYNHAHEVLRDPTRRHPFFAAAINPQSKRWYGRGYYQKHRDLAEEIDSDLNRLSIEKAKSGNLIFENRNGTEEGRAGIPLTFRGPRTFKLTDPTADVPIKVVSVPPMISDIEQNLSNNLTAFMSRAGGVTPGDTQGEELAANTATGLQILQEVKNEAVEAVREQLFEGQLPTDGMQGMLRLFAALELTNLSPGAVTAQFGNARIPTGEMQPAMAPALAEDGTPLLDEAGAPVMEPQTEPVIDPQTGEPVLDEAGQPVLQPVMEPVTVPIATTLIDWARTLTPEKIANMAQLVITKSRGSQILQTNENKLVLIERFLGYTPELQEVVKPIFVDMLLALDVENPTEFLDKLQAEAAANPNLLNTEDDPDKGGAGNPGAAAAPPPRAARQPLPDLKEPKLASSERPVITGRPDPVASPNAEPIRSPI